MGEKCVFCKEELKDWNKHSVRQPIFPSGKCCTACNHAMVLLTLGFAENMSDEEKFRQLSETCCKGWACNVCGVRATNICSNCMKTMCDDHNSQKKMYEKPECKNCIK